MFQIDDSMCIKAHPIKRVKARKKNLACKPRFSVQKSGLDIQR